MNNCPFTPAPSCKPYDLSTCGRGFYLDVDKNELHAKAYLKAAGHFLSSWPQEWTAEQLACAMVADEDSEAYAETVEKVKLPDFMRHAATNEGREDLYFFVDEYICNLAEDFVKFAIDYAILDM